jgi:hypothetical protein
MQQGIHPVFCLPKNLEKTCKNGGELEGLGMGRPLNREEATRDHKLTVTDTGWDGLEIVATQLGYSSKSALIEAIGRGEVEVVKVDGTLGDRFGRALSALLVLVPDLRRSLGDGPKKTGP